ncbi:MAG: hypothetical protein D6712_16495 [Chloroflexi bacterium]|nr:MAG: hypothetical protein D6712_16495 [Chloroflexota bacterium]
MGYGELSIDISVEIDEVVKELRRLGKKVERADKKRILSYAAKPYIAKAQALAPRSERTVFRYGTAKLVQSIRAPKGAGQPVAKYLPGNLAGSIQVFEHGRFKQLDNAIFVGAKISRKGKGRGTFGGRRFDAYYVHFVEYGTRFMRAKPFLRPAWEATKAHVFNRIKLGLKHLLR